MFNKIKEKIFGKQSSTMRALLTVTPNNPVWSTSNYRSFAHEGYKRNPYVFACIRIISDAVAGIPWIVYKRGRRGNIYEVENGGLVAIIKRPNPYQGWGSFMNEFISYLYLSGNGFIESVGPNNGVPKELYALRPDRMRIIAGNVKNAIVGYEYDVGERKVFIESRNVMHFKFFNPLDDWYGFSPVEAAARSIDHNNEARAWNVSLLQNRATPSGAFVAEQQLSDKQQIDLAQKLKSQVMGAKNSGAPLLLWGGLDWKTISLSPVDMDWAGGLKTSSREICSVFGVPPELIGDHENATYSNYENARKAFYQETILPLMDRIRDELNVWLVPKFNESNVFLDYDTEDIEALQEDRQKVWNMVINARLAGIISANEAREMLGYGAAVDGDALLSPANLIPTGESITGEE